MCFVKSANSFLGCNWNIPFVYLSLCSSNRDLRFSVCSSDWAAHFFVLNFMCAINTKIALQMFSLKFIFIRRVIQSCLQDGIYEPPPLLTYGGIRAPPERCKMPVFSGSGGMSIYPPFVRPLRGRCHAKRDRGGEY